MTQDKTAHCLQVDDGIYLVFVSHNLGSLSEMWEFENSCTEYSVSGFWGKIQWILIGRRVWKNGRLKERETGRYYKFLRVKKHF